MSQGPLKLPDIGGAIAQCEPPPPAGVGWGGGGEVKLLQIFKKEGFRGSQFLEEGCWERGDELSQGDCRFYTKNKLSINENFQFAYADMPSNLKFILNKPLNRKYVKHIRGEDTVNIISAYCEEDES